MKRSWRYETANGFARDVERFLNDEAVEARPPSQAYRLKKFIHRNRAMVAAVSAVATALVLGIIGFAWQASVARHCRDLANEAESPRPASGSWPATSAIGRLKPACRKPRSVSWLKWPNWKPKRRKPRRWSRRPKPESKPPSPMPWRSSKRTCWPPSIPNSCRKTR